MRNVEIYYNPYFESTRLIIDGEEQIGGETHLKAFIIGQPLEKWLSPYVFSYQRWNGLLPELMEYLNDDGLHVTLFTLPEYFSKFEEEFNKQTSLIEEKGYSSDLWRALCEEAYLPEDVRNKFLEFVTAKKRFAPQLSISYFRAAEEDLNDNKMSSSVEQLRKIYKCIQEAVQYAKEDYINHNRNAQFWENSERELLRIFD